MGRGRAPVLTNRSLCLHQPQLPQQKTTTTNGRTPVVAFFYYND